MAVDERSRYALYTRLQEVLGEEHATVLIEHLPPVGWADVATKHDLKTELEAVKQELLANLASAIERQTRVIIFSMVSVFVALAGVAFGARIL